MTLRWTARARDDLRAIGRYIARDNPEAARSWVERLRVRARQAAKFPDSGRLVPEVGREDVREFIERNYRIVYRVSTTGVLVLTVFEGHRAFEGIEAEE